MSLLCLVILLYSPTFLSDGWLIVYCQGYEVTHRDIELLKLRNYTVGTKIDDDLLSSDNAQAKLKEILRGLSGFVRLSHSLH